MKINKNLIAKIYEKNMEESIKKSMGKYYTPDFIINYILKQTLENLNVLNRPFVKVIDPACGVGYFLLSAYDILKEYFTDNIDELKEKYKSEKYLIDINGREEHLYGYDYWRLENIHYHILRHCLYGADQDPLAANIARDALRNKNNDDYIENINIVACDSLFYWENLNPSRIKEFGERYYIENLIKFWSNKYDYVIGNPPYIGHKSLTLDYKKWLLDEYSDVYRDKSDISFCFFKRIKSILSSDGICGIISSRYFMESPTGMYLRKYLIESIEIIEIVDFAGKTIFKGIGIATAIYIFKLKQSEEDYYINIHKLNENNIDEKEKIYSDTELNLEIFDSFKLPSHRLGIDRWLIISEESHRIYQKIEEKCSIKLRDIAVSFQGIITGCDRAFVLNHKDLLEKNIELDIVKPWIKNKNVKKYDIKRGDLYLIYSNNIENLDDYINSIQYISKYKSKLENRREYKNGIRNWYELQWGRKEELFDQEKIIFPYKSKSNNFSIDYNNLYFSADIYGLIIKEDYREEISLEYLLGILNSKVYEFYFQLFAKKMGKGIYDYYPNSILDLSIISEEIIISIEKISKEIIDKVDNIDELKIKINEIIMNYFDFTKTEKEKINKEIPN